VSDRSPRFRSVLDQYATYQPGKRVVSPDGKSHKLASNESPFGPLPSVAKAIAAAASDVNWYPDNTAAELTEAIARRHNVPPAHIAFGCGSVGVAQQLLAAAAEPGTEVLFAWRSFEAYPILVPLTGAADVRVPLRDETHDLAAMADAITPRTRLIFVCNPNNPTGTVVRRPELEEFLDRAPGDCLVILDEAYSDYVRDPGVPDGIELYRDRPNVAVLRTFSKAHGLAGLRVGYLVGHEPVAAAVRTTMLPFTVNRRDRLAGGRGRTRRAAGPGGEGARTGPRRTPGPRLDRAAYRGQLRLAAAGRGHPGLRRGMRPGRGQHQAVRHRRRPDLGRHRGGQRRVSGRRAGLPAAELTKAPSRVPAPAPGRPAVPG
jgi:histidinol-phosphate aminotransferase